MMLAFKMVLAWLEATGLRDRLSWGNLDSLRDWSQGSSRATFPGWPA